MVDAAKFWDNTAERYSKSPVRNEEAYQEKLEIIRRYFTPESMVFEFGCGTGSTALALAPNARQIYATDISGKMVEIARDKARAANIENVVFEKATLDDYSGEDESFDVIMGHNILHLMEDPEAAIRKSFRLLKPGGVLVTSTACLGGRFSFWRVAIAVMRLIRYAPYVNSFKQEQLEQYFQNAGFEMEYQGERSKGMAAFIVSRKPGGANC